MSYRKSGFAVAIAWLDNNKPFLAKMTYVSLALIYVVGIPAWPAISTSLSLDPSLGLSLTIGAFIAHLGILLSLFVDIHNKVTPNEMWYQSHQDALTVIRSALNKSLREKPCRIAWIGVSLQSAWLALEHVLRAIEDSNISNVEITLLQTNPEFLRTLPGDNTGLADMTAGQFQYIAQRCKTMEPMLLTTRSEIIVGQYSYMPNIHGLLISDHSLFLSSVRWQGKERNILSVPREPFEFLTPGTNRGRYCIELYRSWLERGLQSAEENNRLYRFPNVECSRTPSGVLLSENIKKLSG